MPEGDTIHRIAGQLAPRLTGQVLARVTTQGLVRSLAGHTVTAVTAHGKHLVIALDDGTHLRVHLGMYGRWRAYGRADGEAALAKLSPGRVSLAVVTADAVFVWLAARTVEISHRRAPRHGEAVAALGPDVLADDFDSRQAAARAARHPTRTIADVLLDQRVAAGIGNIYKSEALFQCGVDPRTPIGALAPDELAAVFETARTMMRANVGDRLGDQPRATRARLAGDDPGDARYLVYGRTHRPCRRCGAAIACARLGDPVARWTWSCPRCQPTRSQRPAGGGTRAGDKC